MTPTLSSIIAATCSKFKTDPLGFVLWAFPWGQPGALQNEYPDAWQIAVLQDLGNALKANQSKPPDERVPVQIAVASGHGIGKTALISWITIWFNATHVCPRTVVTANTFKQLTGKTWAELHKWHQKFILKDLFQWTAESYYLKENKAEWKAEAIAWSKENSEAFAGTHADNVLYQFDEGSAIDNKIYEVSEGAMTTECCVWVVFGNPTRNTGRFRECFGKYRHRWITRRVDSRTARKTNKAKIRQWIEDHGIDSDFVRVRVLGKFPKQSSAQLVSEESVEACFKFDAVGYEIYPVSICVDVARFGDDDSTIGVYQGRKQHEIKGYNGKDTVKVATLTAQAYWHWRNKYQHHINVHIFVDDIGVGGGVTDILKAWNLPVTGVNSSAQAHDPAKFINVRAEMWWRGAEAVAAGYDLIPNDRTKDDLTNIEYKINASQKIQLESVTELKARGLPSPDYATNFVLQFAYPQQIAIMTSTPIQPAVRKPAGSVTMNRRKEAGYGSRKKGN